MKAGQQLRIADDRGTHETDRRTDQRQRRHALVTDQDAVTQLALVAAGLGAAVLPRLGRDPLPKGVTVVPAEPSLRRHVYAAWRTHATRRNVIRAAVEAFQLAAAKLNTSKRRTR